MNRIFFFAITIVGIFLIIIANCGNVPNYTLELTSFRLNIPNLDLDKYFQRVIDLDITPKGEFIIVDGNRPGVLIFDTNGEYLINIADFGSEGYETLISANSVDTLLAIHTRGLLEFVTQAGRSVKRHFLRGRGSIAVAPDGSFLINRMYDSRLMGHCLETYDKDGKLISTFRTPRGSQEGMEILDFAFSSITPDKKIVYVPTTVDSGFIYDLQGNLILAKKIKSKLKPYTLAAEQPGSLVEDMYVNEDGIFLVRVNKKLSTEETVFFDLIEHYNLNFEHIATYSFAVPLTMTVLLYDFAPWYHKFAYKDGIFYFVVSQPFEQLLAFQVKK